VVEAKNVLSSAGLAETMRLCRDGSAEAERHRPGHISFVETVFVLDKPPAEIGHPETIVFYNDSPRFRYDCPEEPIDLHSGIVCSPNNFEYDAPLDESKIRITALARPRYWMNLRDEEYAAEKQVWRDRIAESAVRYIPDFRPNVVDTDVFTPRTIRKFTGHLNGCVYGSPHKALDGKTHLENLYICGNDQGFLGIVGAMLSGITIANAHLLQ
jgi:phytoene dehydrogenase-like protein